MLNSFKVPDEQLRFINYFESEYSLVCMKVKEPCLTGKGAIRQVENILERKSAVGSSDAILK
ncbi:hypothetical protein NCCP2331_22210 [Sporosarcina sp. NCCP-2331]|nr:hypothetical protein NCCP2331_22210 [Sporosarcina sp. NCCP-2331]GLB56173.1 hypothetical protein NCCP2378_19600 [Sporosarcina sp. NCCP-2378]